MWKSILLAIISGMLLALGWPTYGFAGLLFIAFAPLLIIEKQFSNAPFNKKGLRIFLLAMLSFSIWNALSYSWLSQAKPQTEATSQQIQQAWFAYLFPVVMNSLFMAIIFWAYHVIRKKHGDFYGFIFLPAIWMSFEKLHLNWDFSWPWLNLGNGFASYYQWVQWYDITGVFGGTLWIWIANLFLFKAVILYLEHAGKSKIRNYTIGFLLIILLPIGISYIIYKNYHDKGKDIEVALVQPKLNPYTEKYTKSGHEIVSEMIDLSEKVLTNQTNILVTPETSFPGQGQILWNERNNDPYINQIKNWLNNYPNLTVIAGADVAELFHTSQAPNVTSIQLENNLWVNRYNATLQLQSNVDTIQKYDKSKLVVGVEYFPYPKILKPLLGDLMLNFGGSTNSLSKSEKIVNFNNQKNKIVAAPLVCYESIYGEYTSEFVKEGANLISISTNDSWWGNTEGHRQLLDYARLRAIENRRSIVRSANSGISAFINQRGDLIQSLPYDKQGAIIGSVKINTDKTNYTLSGDLLARIALLICGILIAYHIASLILNKKNED